MPVLQVFLCYFVSMVRIRLLLQCLTATNNPASLLKMILAIPGS